MPEHGRLSEKATKRWCEDCGVYVPRAYWHNHERKIGEETHA